MESAYYVNKNAQPNGDHEMHKDGCSHAPNSGNRVSLGNFKTSESAVIEAKKSIPNRADVFTVQRKTILNNFDLNPIMIKWD